MVFALLTGGTIAQRALGDSMERVDLKSILPSTTQDGQPVLFEVLSQRSGSELSWQIVFAVRDRILRDQAQHNSFVVVTGTDALEEFAFALDLLLPVNTVVAVCGSAKPLGVVDGYDGLANFNDALRVVTSMTLRSWSLGVVVVMNDCVHAARYCYKRDSALIGMFVSHPGPLAQLRCGQVNIYYPSLPPLVRHVDAQVPPNGAPNVAIWTMTMGTSPPPALYLDTLDGLIVAGMGTGSISDAVIDALVLHTKRMPIVVVSRVAIGLNYDDYLYKGSVAKYEQRGFILRYGFDQLNALQARIKLILMLLSPNGRDGLSVARKASGNQPNGAQLPRSFL